MPGGWSIAVEMSFYVLFPLLFLMVRSLKIAVSTTLVAAIGSALLYLLLAPLKIINDTELWQIFCSMWLPNQITVFLAGFVTYFLLRDQSRNFSAAKATKSLYPVVLWSAIALLIPLAIVNQSFFAAIDLYAVDFAIIAVCLAHKPSRLLVNRLSCHVGKISFSGYLVHFALLRQVSLLMNHFNLEHRMTPNVYFLTLVLISLAGTIAVATVTYELIEKPGQRLGHRIIHRLEARGKSIAALKSDSRIASPIQPRG